MYSSKSILSDLWKDVCNMSHYMKAAHTILLWMQTMEAHNDRRQRSKEKIQ